ncbi:MAG: DUF1461 domain-containing protein [Candidatus Woesearchaeota archaeon]
MERLYVKVCDTLLVMSIVILTLSFSVLAASTKTIYDIQLGKSDTAHNILDYVNGVADLQVELTDAEREHLEDVRLIFRHIKLLFAAALASTCLLLRSQSEKAAAIRLAGTLLMGICVLLGLAAISFSLTFNMFHEIFFAPETYTFPEDSLLIQNFPYTYFFHSYMAILLTILLAGISTALLAYKYRRKKSL